MTSVRGIRTSRRTGERQEVGVFTPFTHHDSKTGVSPSKVLFRTWNQRFYAVGKGDEELMYFWSSLDGIRDRKY